MKRLGKIDYMQEIGESDWFGDALACIAIVPTRVDYDGTFGVYTLTGISKHFEPVIEGQQIPHYIVSLKQAVGEVPKFAGIERVVAEGGLMPWEKYNHAKN